MLNITGEFALGIILNGALTDFLTISAGIVIMEGTMAFVSDRSEVYANGNIDGNVEFDIVASMTSMLVENLGLGLSTDGVSVALYIVASMLEGLSCVASNFLVMFNRGLRLVELLVGDADAIGALLAIFEIASFIMRPVSIAVRVFANLTAGVLISGLLTPVIGINLFGSLFVSAGIVLNPVLMVYSILFVASYALVECFVGLIQMYVFATLGLMYTQSINN